MYFTSGLDATKSHSLTIDSLGSGEVAVDYAIIGGPVKQSWA